MVKTFKIIQGQQAAAHSVMGRLNAIYAPPGTGKTRLVLTASKDNKLLIIDTEKSFGKILAGMPEGEADINNISTVDATSLADVIMLVNDPLIDLKQFDIVVFDSMTHLIEAEVRNKRREKGRITLPDWGDIGQSFKDLLFTLQMKGIHVIFTVHEEEIANDSGLMQHRPKTDGKAAVAGLIQRADNIMFLDINKDGERVLHTEQSDSFIAKSRDPLRRLYVGKDVNYSTIAADFAVFKAVPATKEQVKEFMELLPLAEFKDNNKFYEHIGWDGKSPLTIDILLRGTQLLEERIELLKAQKDAESDNDSK